MHNGQRVCAKLEMNILQYPSKPRKTLSCFTVWGTGCCVFLLMTPLGIFLILLNLVTLRNLIAMPGLYNFYGLTSHPLSFRPYMEVYRAVSRSVRDSEISMLSLTSWSRKTEAGEESLAGFHATVLWQMLGLCWYPCGSTWNAHVGLPKWKQTGFVNLLLKKSWKTC